MKKILHLVLIISMILVSCSRSKPYEKDFLKDALKEKVSSVALTSLIGSDFMDISPTNCENPYEEVGIVSRKVAVKFLRMVESKKSDSANILNDFKQTLSIQLPDSLFVTDSTNIDEFEGVIENMLTDIYINQGYESFVVKSKKIENLVNVSNYFNDDQKKRVLIFSSVLRHEIGTFKDYFSNSKEVAQTWEECMKEKLQTLQDCKSCFLEKIKCSLFWPTCFTLMAADCLISVIF